MLQPLSTISILLCSMFSVFTLVQASNLTHINQVSLHNASESDQALFDFFQEQIDITYSKQIQEVLPQFFSTSDLKTFYANLEPTVIEPSLADLLRYRQSLNLNDWYYYLLIRETAEQIFTQNEPYYKSYQTVFSWLMLAKSGYKVQLNFAEEDVFLSVYTLDRLYDIPVKEHGMGWMVEISHFNTDHEGFRARVRSDFFLEENDQPFSFKLTQQPTFSKPLLTTRNITFEHENENYALGYTLDRSVLQLVTTLPEISVYDHIEIPLSQFTYSTLIPNLQIFIDQKAFDKKETLQFLLSFTRTGFDYKNDSTYNKCDNITFTPEETLYHRYSDCEDRSVLFAYLVKEILELDVILVDFPEHIAVGVQLGENQYLGKPIIYKNRYYTFCEPTGPDNSLNLGEYPAGLQGETYSILSPTN